MWAGCLRKFQEVSDVQVTVTGCNVEADILGNER